MAEEILSFAVQKLWNLLSQEYDQLHGVKDQVTELQIDLNTLKSFLKDADTKKHTSAMVRNCMDVIKEIIFDAEDIIETFILKDEIGKHGGIKKRIRRLVCIIPEHREIVLEIGSLSKRILKVIRDMKTFGVQQITTVDVKDPQPSQQRVEFARKYESNLVGLEANVEKLVGYLVEEDDVQVVSMTGMGGLGKTTLARQAFHHYKVNEKFDRLVWVCVSQVCNPINVWQTILRTLSPKEEENEIWEMTDTTILQDRLFRLLETIKSLIVFDDVWKEEDWDQIKPIFPYKNGSKVLLTSRNERVVGCGETCINFKPECLSDSDSWTLFQRIAMPSKNASELKNVAKEMEEMGKQMIKHCKGLPLAVRVLGGLLAAKCTVKDWKRLSENIGPSLVGRTNISEDNNNSFYHVLSLSFEELPGYLKYCFLYLAHFPEDHEINVKDLAYFWAAEGILTYNDGETIRDVGDSYIEELVRRNMVISERDNTTSRFETCSLHDMMREICMSKAKEENFIQVDSIHSSRSHDGSLSTSRRFVFHSPLTLHVAREIKNSKVQSLVVVYDELLLQHCWNLPGIRFTRLQLLRVLHLPDARFDGRKLPDSIRKLIHLRYLNLDHVTVSHLPYSLQNLKLLIYLNLNVLYSVHMPNVLMGMKELKYLALPRDMHKKKKLELSHLVNLETLINFSAENCSLVDLHGMRRLRILGIRITGESSLENLSASIDGLRYLEELDIYYDGAKGFNTNTPLPYKLQFPSCLTSLTLEESRLEEDPMPILEKMLHLNMVTLYRDSFSGRKIVCSSGGFPQLQKLKFWGLEEWEEWIVEEGSMPLLHTLQIYNCKKLKELPDGLRFITSVKDFVVGIMGEGWKERLSEGGEDYYKVQHIPCVEIYE